MSGFHEEDPLGKSYDWRLLLRLLRYLRPYRGAVAASFLLILAMAALDLAGPYLTKVAIDRHISRGDGAGLCGWPALAAGLVGGLAVRFGQVYLLQMTGQRIVFDLRREIFGHLQRLHLAYFDRNPVGRLMTRVTSDVRGQRAVHLGRGHRLRRPVHALRHHGRDVGHELAVGAHHLADPCSFWSPTGSAGAWNPSGKPEVGGADQRLPAVENLTGMAVVQLFRREERNLRAFADINRKHADADVKVIVYDSVF